MVSNDVITIELFNAKMETIVTQIQLGNERLRNELTNKINGVHGELTTRMDKLEARIEVMDARLTGIENRIDDLKSYMSSGFGIIAVVVALLALAPAIANFIQNLRKPSVTLEDVRKLMRDEVPDVVNKVMSTKS